jgi:hypothetical protein
MLGLVSEGRQVKDKEIDDILEQAVGASPEVNPELLSRVSMTIGTSLRPVRPLAPAWMLVSVLWLIAAVISIAAASLLGMEGIRRLSGAEALTIFPVLALLIGFTAWLNVAEMTPGAFRIANPRTLLLMTLLLCLAVDAALFHDYQTASLVRQGIPCLRAGLIVAAPVGVASWLTLRRGFAVDASAAGLAAGTLAGLAGLAMLEFHCPNHRALHIMIWHTGVIPISAFAGSLLGLIRR